MEKRLVLNIETSTNVCSASLSAGKEIIAARESHTGRSHASLLTVFIDELMRESDTGYGDLAAVAVSMGPGSYTGLRIGVSAAKGICYGAGVPLLAVDTLRLMAMMAIKGWQSGNDTGPTTTVTNGRKTEAATSRKTDNATGNDTGPTIDNATGRDTVLLCPMIDARRMEVYTALYDAYGRQVAPTGAHIIDREWFDTLPGGSRVLFFGNGADKCNHLANGENLVYIDGIYPSAGLMPPLSDEALNEGRIEDTAYFEPYYLKDFIATTPRNRLL
ncbi:MAG: tRNA (adenosine(37)-N6)-threonylcarbamoyltransferase complex dimerization subunit type 1 TsaB [Marinilabiliales bacterium]|nr:MAG: tRNA (adenosine(37)-N6)-threonylcarbamoyltransferase complex dimerization subunit type 1 TsaB [Marinilabiliales bacterium]